MPNSLIKYIVIGRTCSGKKTLLKSLKSHGIRVNRSFTTNPDADAEIYEIISEKRAAEIENKLFIKNFGDCVYFTTKERFEACHVISLDVNGLKAACEAYPAYAFRIVNAQMADDDRLTSFISKIPVEEKITAEEDFVTRCREEDAEMTEFENQVTDATELYGLANIVFMHALLNNGNPENSVIFDFYKTVKAGLNSFERMCGIIVDLMLDDRISYEFANDSRLITDLFVKCEMSDKNSENTVSTLMPFSRYVEYTLADPAGAGWNVIGWLNCENVGCVFESFELIQARLKSLGNNN
jgi:hypothetical protein